MTLYPLDPDEIPQPHPENIGLGGVTCRCGNSRIPNLEASGLAASMLLCCPTCGEWMEAMST